MPAIGSKAVIFADPNQPVELKPGHPGTEVLIIRIGPELLVETATRLRIFRTSSQIYFRKPLVPLATDDRLSQVIESIISELESAATGWREITRSMVDQLAVLLLRSHLNLQRSDEIELSRAGMVDRRLRRAIEFIHDNCGRDLSLAEIAKAAYLSEFHFARLFKKITGATPHAYLATIRIEKARRLLAETDLPINDVGAQVGYGSQSHFTKIFREATGITPSAFRKAILDR